MLDIVSTSKLFTSFDSARKIGRRHRDEILPSRLCKACNSVLRFLLGYSLSDSHDCEQSISRAIKEYVEVVVERRLLVVDFFEEGQSNPKAESKL